jgi:hypothetical protein
MSNGPLEINELHWISLTLQDAALSRLALSIALGAFPVAGYWQVAMASSCILRSGGADSYSWMIVVNHTAVSARKCLNWGDAANFNLTSKITETLLPALCSVIQGTPIEKDSRAMAKI